MVRYKVIHRIVVVPTRLEGMETERIKRLLEILMLSRPDLRGWKQARIDCKNRAPPGPDPT